MDSTDLKICRNLLMDSHQTMRELSGKLNLSINAVHKRVQRLIETRIISDFRTSLTVIGLSAVTILVFGRVENITYELLKKNLERNHHVYWIAMGAGNYAYVGAYLHRIEELERIVNYVKSAGNFSEITVGISTSPIKLQTVAVGTPHDLDFYDFKIIKALQRDARKAAAEIAEFVGLAPKTINKRLEAMEAKHLLEYSIGFYPDKEGDIMIYIHLTLDSSGNKLQIFQELYQQFDDNILFIWVFSNLPDFLFAVFWVPSFKEMQLIQPKISKIPGIKAIELNVTISGVILDTWRDSLIEEKLRELTPKEISD
jgi:Lrp/AsnC family leucine-responsive transcriptional regulator